MQNHYLNADELRLLKAVKHCNDKFHIPYAVNPRHIGLPTLEQFGLVVVEGGSGGRNECYVFATVSVIGVKVLHEHEEDAA